MSHRASLFGRGYSDRHLDSARLRFRRALTLTVMTILVPGSAQLVMGRKRTGWTALFVWLLLVVFAAVTVFVALTDRGRIITVLTDARNLGAIQIGIVVIAALWLLLFFDACRLGLSSRLRRTHFAIVTVFNTGVAVAAVIAVFLAAQLINAPRQVVTQVFTSTETSAPEYGRYNILLLGSDSGKDRYLLRPDSMTILSVDSSSGDTALISLPRNLQNVPFPVGSPMYELYPNGFNCSECLLNAVYTYATNQVADQYPPGVDPGMAATIGVIENITGLKINYHILINMEGFKDLVDAVGGITVDVKKRIPIDGVVGPVKGWIEPGTQHLDGFHALWYARARHGSSDFDRMGRQKCVMSAMVNQLSPQNVLLHAQEISDSSKKLLETDIPASELDLFIKLALKARDTTIVTAAAVPPLINTADPDFDKIRGLVQQAIRESEGKEPSGSPADDPAAEPTTQPTPSTPTFGPSEESAEAANNTDDLEATC